MTREHLDQLDLALLPPERVYRVWLAYHGLTASEHAAEGGVQQSDLSLVTSGRRRSRPLVEWLEQETGIPADSWPQYQEREAEAS